MIKSNRASLGAVALALGAIAVTCAADGPHRMVPATVKAAGKEAKRATKALAHHQVDVAVAAAERAVALAPREAAYRMLLGQSYLQAGRFQSAAQAFADTVALGGGDGKAALNLALAQVATGDWQAARATLIGHEDIPAADRGLALALAGDTAGAVTLLTQVARSPESSPKVRQNLALAYALAGQWQAARVVAATDLSPADVDARLQQWAAFAQPQAASDQVATLLGVRPADDRGQPTALALNAPVPMTATSEVAVVAPVVAPAPSVAPAPVVAAIAAPAPAPVVEAEAAPSAAVAFAPHRETILPMSAFVIHRASVAYKVPVRAGAAPASKPTEAKMMVAKAPAFTPANGPWYVQLGAYDSAGVAKDAWGRATRRFTAFAAHQPQGMTFKTGAATFFRLSVGGFSRPSADQACRAYRARGGSCFVRMGAGDQMASWASKGRTQLAMR